MLRRAYAVTSALTMTVSLTVTPNGYGRGMDVRIRRSAPATAESRASWLASLGLAHSENAFQAEQQAAKIRQVSAMWPAAVYAQLGAGVLVIAATVYLSAAAMLAPLAMLTGAMLLTSLAVRLLFRHRRFWALGPIKQNFASIPIAAGLGAAITLLAALASQLPNEQLATVLATGVGVAALITLVAMLAMHVATMAFATAGAITLIAATGNIALGGSAAILVGCFWVAIVAHARFDDIVSQRRQIIEGKSRRANRLLAEFEANGQGWFWETDRSGDLVYISEKLAKLFGEPMEKLVGKPMTRMIRSEGSAEDGERTLGFHFSSRSAFTEITVRAAIDETECWWSLSGRPIIDEIGQFRGFTGTGTDLTERRRSQDEVHRLARYDSLTGLANRQHMRGTLEEGLLTNEGTGKRIALLLLDLDRFKQVNDTMGHPVGDALLKQVATRLFSTVGERGMVGRLGGDEFQVILPNLQRQGESEDVARAIIAALSQPYMIDGVTLTIGCSIGIAKSPDHGHKSEELIRNADLALYAAKADGRGVYRAYEPEMHAGAKKRKRLEDDLRKALVNNELHLTYQPIVSTGDAKIVGYETLIRWNHPTHGAISPADFIPVAEDIRLIEQIGEWVLRKACEDAVKWPVAARVAVNVSPIQFANPNLPKVVTSALANSGLPPERLELEITESVFLDESSDTDAMFKALKRIGVRLALDDFGTGYSALGYLKTAPFDKIKIDQSFIRGAAVAGNRNAAIIKAIVSLANTLYMETTAEGVELEDEIALVRELGCSHIQGFIYGKPMRQEDVIPHLQNGSGKAVASGYRASRSPRTKMLRSSNAEAAGRTRKVLIRNISATGAMIEGIGDVEPDTDVLIELLENQMFPAKVRWSAENRAGLEFARSFDLERLNQQPGPPVRKAANG